MRANIESPRRAKEIAELRERQEYSERLFDEVQRRNDLAGSSSGRSSDGTKAGVLLGTLIPGIILLFVAIFTLNVWAMIFGFILFGIGIGMMGYATTTTSLYSITETGGPTTTTRYRLIG